MNLYLRLIWTWLRARFRARVLPGATIELKLRVWPNDLDINNHMNNGRYLTIADLALIEYFVRSGFLPVALKNGWKPMLGGSIISYRRGLKPFASYTLRFTVQCWDEHWNYMRFEFIRDGRIHEVLSISLDHARVSKYVALKPLLQIGDLRLPSSGLVGTPAIRAKARAMTDEAITARIVTAIRLVMVVTAPGGPVNT